MVRTPGIRRLPKTVKQLLNEPCPSSSSSPPTTITGHVRSIRRQKRCTFALVDDGSTSKGLQAVFRHGEGKMNTRMVDKLRELTFGSAVSFTGKLVESAGPGQDIELLVGDEIEVLGRCDPTTYPLQPHKSNSQSHISHPVASGAHSVEFLRDHLHLRLRTPTVQHTIRLRAKAKEALESYLNSEQEFIYVHTPLITGIDAEGGGESFRVGVGDSSHEGGEFFGRPAHLTVSSQLHLEAFQAALGRVYTLAPCFRAERSMTGRHLAEFWMLECEWGGLPGGNPSQNLHGLCTFVEDLLRYTIARVLPRLSEQHEESRVLHSAAFSERSWPRVTYTEAIHILQQQHRSSQSSFSYPPILGHALQSEHEKYLAEVHFGSPVFVLDYPKGVKPFYMRVNDTQKEGGELETVACFDLLVPGVGELIGGSVREERYEVLRRNMVQAGLIPTDSYLLSSSTSLSSDASSSSSSSSDTPVASDHLSPSSLPPLSSDTLSSSFTSSDTATSAPSLNTKNAYEWYLDLRRHGSIPHGGFGMGFERLILWLEGGGNIRETIGMPRWKGRMSM